MDGGWGRQPQASQGGNHPTRNLTDRADPAWQNLGHEQIPLNDKKNFTDLRKIGLALPSQNSIFCVWVRGP
jgi:hypothetical protein